MSGRMPLMAGNWKMYFTVGEAVALLEELKGGISRFDDREVVVAPPFTALSAVASALAGSPIRLAAQNCHWESQGAYTGEIAPAMLKDLGCRYVIVGHSERRQYFGETDGSINRKMVALLALEIVPILCVGETLEQRQAGETLRILADQLTGAFEGLKDEEVGRVVLAYEPVWAIGTGHTATPEQAQEAHAFIRDRLADRFNNEVANGIRILYGGSVKPENVDTLMAQPDIDGALVGGASLKSASFVRIVDFVG
ncbi:MAG: triose-phosphate isomerase [Deltaproteobacteria bacterium]|nr:MAG: triose-phosphate isomerase [Deltaproteobacteria bacterium]